MHTRFMGLTNFVASCVAKSDDTLPYLTDVKWYSA
jgi:hypothetical protein